MSEQFEIKLSWLKNGRDSEVDLSFCRLQIIVGGKNVTQYTAEHTAGDDHLEIPSYFLAEWLAENWWALLWEPRKNEDTSDHPDFLARHSFLTAQHGFALPKVLIVPAGRAVHVNALPRDVQFADVRFRNLASVWLPRTDVEKDLERFVRSVSERLSGAKISGTSLQEAWELITKTTAEEIFFCRSMGALGLSPYAQNDAIENVLERAVSTLGERLTLDLCLVSTPENFSDTARIAHLAKASSDNGAEISLEPLARIAAPSENYSIPAWRRGEQAAKRVRAVLGIKENDPLGADILFEKLKFDVEQKIVLPEQRDNSVSPISGLVSKDDMYARAALLQPVQQQRRFSAARAAYTAWASEPKTSRLITQVVTRDQQASRSFAAEITAPIAYLRSSAHGGRLSHEQVFELAANLKVGPDVVKKHAQNKGLQVGQV
jgi:hypothetical protein